MTKAEVEAALWKRFEKWMEGQTLGVNPDGSFDFYKQDVDRFMHMLDRLVLRLPPLD